MIQQFLEWLNAIGLPGLFLVMFLEGTSFPFPGVIMVLTFGYLLSPGYLCIVLLAIGMSISYSIASLIPYYLAMKLERFLPARLIKGVKKGQAFFNRYGVWSIALSRPFGVGNYISYVAGMSGVHVFKYFILTFLGIYPWSYIMIFLGDYFNGNYDAFMNFFSSNSIYIYSALFIIIVVIAVFTYKKMKWRKGIKHNDK